MSKRIGDNGVVTVSMMLHGFGVALHDAFALEFVLPAGTPHADSQEFRNINPQHGCIGKREKSCAAVADRRFKSALYLFNFFPRRFKHGHHILRRHIRQDVVDLLKHESSAWGQNSDPFTDVLLHRLGRL